MRGIIVNKMDSLNHIVHRCRKMKSIIQRKKLAHIGHLLWLTLIILFCCGIGGGQSLDDDKNLEIFFNGVRSRMKDVSSDYEKLRRSPQLPKMVRSLAKYLYDEDVTVFGFAMRLMGETMSDESLDAFVNYSLNPNARYKEASLDFLFRSYSSQQLHQVGGDKLRKALREYSIDQKLPTRHLVYLSLLGKDGGSEEVLSKLCTQKKLEISESPSADGVSESIFCDIAFANIDQQQAVARVVGFLRTIGSIRYNSRKIKIISLLKFIQNKEVLHAVNELIKSKEKVGVTSEEVGYLNILVAFALNENFHVLKTHPKSQSDMDFIYKQVQIIIARM